MPWYEMEGIGRDTGRKRKRKYQARSVDAAIKKASADGTIIDVATVTEVAQDGPPARQSGPRTIHTKVRGVTHDNPDGSSRQQFIRTCSPGRSLHLVREPGNRYDPNAIQVIKPKTLMRGPRQLGYLSVELAAELAPEMAAGATLSVAVANVTGGRAGESYGLNIVVTVEPR